jgi:hypothetical protein
MDGKAHRHKPRRHVKRTKSVDDYIRQIKKLVEDYEKCLGNLSKPVEMPEQLERAYRGVGFHEYDEEPCAVRSFMQAHPDHKGPIWIACPCRRCSVWC